MGSTGEPDRKRRHLSSVSPAAAAGPSPMAKKLPFLPSSDDKKLDKAVLQYQNQKILQKLEVQKVEYKALEKKFNQLDEKQRPYDSTLKTVRKSFRKLVVDLEECSNGITRSSSGQDITHASAAGDDGASILEDAFLGRLRETGAMESSSSNNCLSQVEDRESATGQVENILHNIGAAITDLWHLKDGLHAAILKELSEDGECRKKVSSGLYANIKSLRIQFSDLHLKQKGLASELQSCHDIDAKYKAEINRLKGELEDSVSELTDSHYELATLRAERDATKGAFSPFRNVGNKPAPSDKVRDKLKELHELESSFRELSHQASSRLLEIKSLHDGRIRMLEVAASLQSSLKNVKCISSSHVLSLLRDRLEKLKTEVSHYQAVFMKLQIEKENLVWREKELNMRNDIVDVFRRSSVVADSRTADLSTEMQKQINERNLMKTKLEEALRDPGRKHIIAEFKALVSSFPEEMGSMQSQLSNFKQAASDISRLRANAQSLSSVLWKKEQHCLSLSANSAKQVCKMRNLQDVLHDLREGDSESKLILEMYMRELTEARDFLQAKDLEYGAWAQVQSLKSSLDERNLELRVKTANEAEAISQQKLATAEAEIADQRQKLKASKRNLSSLSGALKSKSEESEAYLSEIETIGQAYDEMQTQNQHLLQQITERDDYNIKLVLEGVKARQLQDLLHLDKRTLERESQQARISLDFYRVKVARIEDQLKVCSDHVRKLEEDKSLSSITLESMQRKLQDLKRSMNQAKESMDISQSKVETGGAAFLELQIDLEIERFAKRRMEEDLEVLRRKVSYLQAQRGGSSLVEKLHQELKEYKEIVKCSICFERPKEVVITKCFHLFCNSCVQRIVESRHRKCPACAASFGHNDVKPVYI